MLSFAAQGKHMLREVEHRFKPGKSPWTRDRALVRILGNGNPASAIIFAIQRPMSIIFARCFRALAMTRTSFIGGSSPGQLGSRAREIAQGASISWLPMWRPGASTFPRFRMFFFMSRRKTRKAISIARDAPAGPAARAPVISLVDIMECMELERIAKNMALPFLNCPAHGRRCGAGLLHQAARFSGGASAQADRGLKIEQGRFLSFACQLGADEDENGNALMAMLLDDAYKQSRETCQLPQRLPKTGETSSGRGKGKRSRSRKKQAAIPGAKQIQEEAMPDPAERFMRRNKVLFSLRLTILPRFLMTWIFPRNWRSLELAGCNFYAAARCWSSCAVST